MFEDVPGRLISGAIWGLGAGVALNILRGRKGKSTDRDDAAALVKPVTKTLMKVYVASTDRVRALTAEARENLGDMYAEVQAERGSTKAGGDDVDIPAGDADHGGVTKSAPRRSRTRPASSQ